MISINSTFDFEEMIGDEDAIDMAMEEARRHRKRWVVSMMELEAQEDEDEFP